MDIELTEDKKQLIKCLMKKAGMPEICPDCGGQLKFAKFSHDDFLICCLTGFYPNPFLLCTNENCEYKYTVPNRKQNSEVERNYIVATAIGGVMEHPDFEYVDQETVKAKSEQEAILKYEKIHPHNYWFARVIG